MKALSTLTGLFVFVIFGIMGTFLLMCGNVEILIQPYIYWGLVVIPFGAVVLSFGWHPALRAVSASRLFFIAAPSQFYTRKDITVLNAWINVTYLSSVALLLLGGIIIIGNSGGNMEVLGMHVARAILTPFSGFVICEGFLRPVKYRVQMVVDEGHGG